MTREELKSTAMAMRKRAYCPYSYFAVGAALEWGLPARRSDIGEIRYAETSCISRNGKVGCLLLWAYSLRRILPGKNTSNWNFSTNTEAENRSYS